jgi:hypothetical protein
VVFAFLTVIYQGLMTVYYYRRRNAVEAALNVQDEERRFH